ncbi:hypothetical protein [Tenacibaculum maritimum]|uniref:hypothetical protein n=1 Tax=Tenacibaculum maritimum TaxID=107401 RepID=UPI0038774D21
MSKQTMKEIADKLKNKKNSPEEETKSNKDIVSENQVKEEKTNIPQEEIKEINISNLSTEKPATSKKKTKLDFSEKIILKAKEKEYINKERVYIDNNISKKLKILKLATGLPIGTLANVIIEEFLKENEKSIKKILETLI